MRFFKFLLSLLATGGLVYVLSTSFSAGGLPLPAFGNLLNPFSGFWQNGTSASSLSFNLKSGEIAGLQAPVKVEFDDREVPHIFAQNTSDAIFVQGYLHAQNRLFQMDIATRKTSGRLSEVIPSEKALESDMNERRYGMLWAAENAIKGWQKEPESYKLLESYVAGVNAYISTIDDKHLPVEYKILGFKPEPWTVLKTALFFKEMCKTLARGDMDIDASNALAILGEKDFRNLIPDTAPDQTPIAPKGTSWNFKAATNTTPSIAPASLSGLYEVTNDAEKVEGIGSNNWVVGPQKTANGHPILCGDPHLGLTLPSIWYECQLVTPEMNTYGVSLPGIPFVVIGFNENIAWTQTNAMVDVAEWYKIKWKDDAHEQYELDGKWENVVHKIEQFHVKGRGVVTDDVKYTKFGPVVSENNERFDNGLAFRWICHDESKNDINIFYLLDKAKNYDEFTNAIKTYSYPMQNFAFASKTGDYAIYTQGRMPIMQRGSGRFVSDGTKSANTWGGDVPFEHMPHVKNLSQGFVMSANQNQTDASYPYDFHTYTYETVRSRYLQKKLMAAEKVTVDDMKKLQYDAYSIEAEEALPVLISNLDSTQISPAAHVFLDEMKKWNFDYTSDSKAAMYYDIWVDNTKKMVWDELQATNPKARILKPRFWSTLRLIKEEPMSKYFDIVATPEKEDAKTILTKSLNNVVDSMTLFAAKSLNPNMTYNDYRNTIIGHIGLMKGMGSDLIHANGSGQAVNCLKTKHGPSWRMIVEMGEKPKAFIVYPGGQTGNPGSKQYEQFIENWSKGDYYEAVFLSKAAEGNPRVANSFDLTPKK